MDKALQSYRTIITLPDGVQVVLRPLQHDDGQRLLGMFKAVGEGDLDYFRSDVRNQEVLEDWVSHLDYDKVFPLIAVSDGRIVGDATLHFGTGPNHHIAEARIFIIEEFRRRGLGTLMLKTLVQLAKRMGLYQLVAEIPMEQSHVIKAFKATGFSSKFIREDYFMTPDGLTHDVVGLTMHLVDRTGEF
ncbi:MAG: GNAT family N-acetyltransferase [Chloroflexota bacterium]|nr:GNAT family N-acetyltransferase [Chloroflexota bacterium]